MTQQVTWDDNAYAGFWRRAVGYLIDGFLFGSLTFVTGLVIGLSSAAMGGGGDGLNAAAVVIQIVFVVLAFLYDVIMTSKFGWTLGKRAVNVEVRTSEGELPSFGLAAGRYFARFLSAIPLLLGFFWAGWDSKKQTWHDKICSTYVLKREAIGAGAGQSAPGQAWGTQSQAGWGSPQPQPGWGTPQQSGWDLPSQQSAPSASQWGDAPQGSAMGTAAPAGQVSAETIETADEATSDTGAGGPAAGPTWGEPSGGGPDPAAAEPEPVVDGSEPGVADPDPASAAPDWGTPPTAAPGWDAPPPEHPADDPNLVAISRSGVGGESARWIEQVASQVDARLDRVTPEWRSFPQADAARACAFGLLVGYLGRTYPHMEADLGRVAESHPSFSTLLEGSRLATLKEIAGDPGRATAWLGPLIEVGDPAQIRRLLD